jgi:hypothetical protein
MYKVYKNGKVITNSKWTFKTYEEARSFLRRWIRENVSMDTRLNKATGFGELIHNNPSISDFGYSIRQV